MLVEMIATLTAGLLLAMQDERPTHIDKFMETRWTRDVMQGQAWHEYPRPQLVREEWMNLNGNWEYAIQDKDSDAYGGGQGLIRVPYAIQSRLSGVQRHVYENQSLWYRRKFEIPQEWSGQSVMLNFGAVDWKCKVLVNGTQVGEHFGGYDPFSLDITGALKSGENELIVQVWDPTDTGDQPHGKQVFNPNGIWYTAVTGIWQTVWLEPVTSRARIVSSEAITELNGKVKLNIGLANHSGTEQIEVDVIDKGKVVARKSQALSNLVEFSVPNPKHWSPDSPNLYDLDLRIVDKGEVIDRVQSYFGIRTIELKRDAQGIQTYLNGKPIFMFGLLDQGWWPDGLYTPPTDEALLYDLQVTKRAGYNTVRKHVKVEPARFYRHCDELGLLVWQDMPSSLKYGPKWDMNWRQENPAPDGKRPGDSAVRFLAEWDRIMAACRAYPSVVVWVPFNEAWGQHDTASVAEWTKKNDPNRLVNPASGGNFVLVGDIFDIHEYPGPGAPTPQKNMAIVNGEFGGLGLPVKGHTWQDENNWGYQSFANSKELMGRYEQLIDQLLLLKGKGLSGAIYTQTTDVEVEVNGLLTYDRAVMKMPIDWLRKVNERVYGPAPKVEEVVPTSAEAKLEWFYTESQPGDDWYKSGATSGWKKGQGGFGSAGTPGAQIGTPWTSSDIWIKREFEVKDASGDIWLSLHHDEAAEVYLNGVLLGKYSGYTTQYALRNIQEGILKVGKNTLAIHCHQTSGGQFIDAGFVRLRN